MDTAFVSVVLALAGCVAASLLARGSFTVPRPPWGRVLLGGLWLLLAALLWVSDYPASWRLPDVVNYMAEVTPSAFRILCVTATGGVIFGSMVALLFLAGRRRR